MKPILCPVCNLQLKQVGTMKSQYKCINPVCRIMYITFDWRYIKELM